MVPVLAVVCAGPSTLQADETEFEKHTKELKKIDGLWTIYYKEQKLLVNLKKSQVDKNYIVLTSIAQGISNGMVLGGMSWGFGDDVVWSFRKVGDKMHVLRRNVRFRAKAGTPEADAVKIAYSDSVLYSVPILVEDSGAYLIDVTKVFLNDDQQIGRSIGSSFRFAADRSTIPMVKAYDKNIELRVAAVYSGSQEIDTVSDPRGVQVQLHYSISMLPSNGYETRAADDRIGYFLTAIKDFSDDSDDAHFVRYINRWDLQKADPKADLSPPKEPIIFHLEKTVPIALRPIVRDGIEEWNRAFEKIGFANAIEVRQQRDDDQWDPEDIQYNTFRWITADAGFAMGPSRVNPMTGEILDADILFDSSFLQSWDDEYETLGPETMARLFGDVAGELVTSPLAGPARHSHDGHSCALCRGMQQQMGFANTALAVRGAAPAGDLPHEFVKQALKEVVMHEVGHTLGLRHNFKASAWKSLKDLGDGTDPQVATVASVMDYSPANISLDPEKQGLYFTQTIGPYDHWAIEYGYKPISGDEKEELKKIAARGAEEGLDYATDEDTRSTDSDPLSNRFDLGDDPVAFAERQMKIADELLPKMLDRVVEDGEGYQRARRAFGMLLSEYWRTALFASRVPGGVYVHRDHKGDEDGRTPFVVVDAEDQRAAMKLLTETAFQAPEYDAKLLNSLSSTRWYHWGSSLSERLDYPIHDTVGRMQSMILSRLLGSLTLTRLLDNELKVAEGEDAYTLAEHLDLLVKAVFSEIQDPKAGDYGPRNPYIAGFRRQLQRETVKSLATMTTRNYGAPDDARALARMHLSDLDSQMSELLKKKNVKLDPYTRAHLMDTGNRIKQVLDAELSVSTID